MEPSPRSAKRRKLDGNNASTPKSTDEPALRSSIRKGVTANALTPKNVVEAATSASKSSVRRAATNASTPKATEESTAATRSSARRSKTNDADGTSASAAPVPVTKPSAPAKAATKTPASAAKPRSSRASTSHKSTTNSSTADIDVYNDIDGANQPKNSAAALLARATATRGSAPKKARLDEEERSRISKEAHNQGLNSLRARLNARILAQEKERRAGSVSADSRTEEEAKKDDAEEAKKKAEMKRFEDEQYDKAIKRVAAKEKAAQLAAEKMRAKEAKARGEEPVQVARPQGRPTKTVEELAKGKQTAAQKRSERKKQVIAARNATSKKGKKSRTKQRPSDENQDEIPEDTACNVCGKLSSMKSNMIVLCDGCDNAYHQKCIHPHIPNEVIKNEGLEWFCLECTAEERAEEASQQKDSDDSLMEAATPEDEPELASTKVVQTRGRGVGKSTVEHPRRLSPMVLDLPEAQTVERPSSKAAALAKLTPRPPPQSVMKRRANISTGLSIQQSDLQHLQQTLLEQITGRRQNELSGLLSETKQIANLVDQTISAGESNSLLIIGARGSGKTAVVESIVRLQTRKQPDAFHVVRLNGFIHTDDKIALREIWRQLGREMQTDDFEAAGGKNYADALTTLLALLSHPSEIGQGVDGDDAERVKSKSVVFVLDEFDLFTTHPRQTLLYNLFDIAQSRKAPILVLGLTTRFDVAEQLEKRVKSRFSHRFVHLGLAKGLDEFKTMCHSCLLPIFEGIEPTLTEGGENAWLAVLSDLFATEEMGRHLKRIYYTTKSVPAFQSSMLVPCTTLPTTAPIPRTDRVHDHDTHEDTSGTHTVSAETLLSHLTSPINLSTLLTPPDSKLSLLHTLSTLQLALLISAARLTIIHDTDTVSFALAYEEYKTLASRARITASASAVGSMGGVVASGMSRVWGKDVARGAWEGLVDLELVMLEGSGGGGKDGRACRVDVLLEEIGDAGVEMGTVMARWCKEI